MHEMFIQGFLKTASEPIFIAGFEKDANIKKKIGAGLLTASQLFSAGAGLKASGSAFKAGIENTNAVSALERVRAPKRVPGTKLLSAWKAQHPEIRRVNFQTPEDIVKAHYSEIPNSPRKTKAMQESAEYLKGTGAYLPRMKTVTTSSGKISPSTMAHELGHHTQYYGPTKKTYRNKLMSEIEAWDRGGKFHRVDPEHRRQALKTYQTGREVDRQTRLSGIATSSAAAGEGALGLLKGNNKWRNRALLGAGTAGALGAGYYVGGQ